MTNDELRRANEITAVMIRLIGVNRDGVDPLETKQQGGSELQHPRYQLHISAVGKYHSGRDLNY